MEIVMLGAPGTGKGTVGKLLSKEFGIPHVSSGEIFRSYSQRHGELADEIASYINSGTLVPDELTIKLIKKRLNEPDMVNGFILDGFPRTVAQGESLNEILAEQDREINIVVNLDLSDEEIIDRIVKRRTCPNPECREIYNLEFKPPKVEGICDVCGSRLIVRSDDNEETVRQRLKTYHETSEELVEYYKKQALLYTVKLNKESNVTTMGIAEEIRSYFE
ncbi:MAG: adenylate kinase [Clostridia bacterium]|nr:adenylate kinase [Clostridia bacterium]